MQVLRFYVDLLTSGWAFLQSTCSRSAFSISLICKLLDILTLQSINFAEQIPFQPQHSSRWFPSLVNYKFGFKVTTFDQILSQLEWVLVIQGLFWDVCVLLILEMGITFQVGSGFYSWLQTVVEQLEASTEHKSPKQYLKCLNRA